MTQVAGVDPSPAIGHDFRLSGSFPLRRMRTPDPLRSFALCDSAQSAKTTSVAGVMLAFITRYGMRRLPMILQQVWTAWQKRASRIDPDMPKYPTTDFSATATRH